MVGKTAIKFACTGVPGDGQKCFGGEIDATEHKCKENNSLRREAHAGNWLELAGIGKVDVANWLELARTGSNWLELARTGSNWLELAKTG
jgi:hypothetical protein